MESKKFNHKEIERCKISNKQIDTTKERYSIVVECEGKEVYAIGFYRSELLLDLVKGNLETVSKELMDRHKKIAGNVMQQLKSVMGNVN